MAQAVPFFKISERTGSEMVPEKKRSTASSRTLRGVARRDSPSSRRARRRLPKTKPAESVATQAMLQAALEKGGPLQGRGATGTTDRQGPQGQEELQEAAPSKSFKRQQSHSELVKFNQLGREEGAWPFKSSGELQESWQAAVPQSLEARAHETCGRRAGGSRQALSHRRHESANPLWEAAGLEEEPLPGVHHTGMAAEGAASQSCTSSNPHTPGDASRCHRQQLGHSLAADPRGGRSVQDPLVRRRCGRPAGCDGVPQVDERAGKEHPKPSAEGLRKRVLRRQRERARTAKSRTRRRTRTRAPQTPEASTSERRS